MPHVDRRTIAMLGWLLAASAQAASPCALLGRADAAAALGSPVDAGVPEGPGPDEDDDSQRSVCTYRGPGNAFVVVLVREYASAAEARKHFEAGLADQRKDGAGTVVTEESGPGDRAFSALPRQGGGGTYGIVKKNKVAAVLIGNDRASANAATRDALRKAVTSVASKL